MHQIKQTGSVSPADTHSWLVSALCTGPAGKYDVTGSKGKEMEISLEDRAFPGARLPPPLPCIGLTNADVQKVSSSVT